MAPNPQELKTELETCIGYSFVNLELMMEALTHKSYFNEQSNSDSHNERLEFLGDAVLDLIISKKFMSMATKWPEGKLTRYRAALVNEENLAQVAVNLNLGPFILLGKGEDKNNGREKASILADCVEAIVGAIFQDSDFYACEAVVLKWFEQMIDNVIEGDGMADAKTQLQQQLQSSCLSPVYTTVGIEGPDHDRTYEIEITVNGAPLARGMGKSKKEAEKQAAQNGLVALCDQSESGDPLSDPSPASLTAPLFVPVSNGEKQNE
ncbi:MAG: ribonuclease III [Deltaproteobacteria bacterium]|nr:ribonuclease III [Deltaproteobacteria bacterium]